MSKNFTATFVLMILIDALVLAVTIISFWNNIIPGNFVGIVIVLLFVINGFIFAWLLDLLEPIFKTLGNVFGGLGGFLGK